MRTKQLVMKPKVMTTPKRASAARNMSMKEPVHAGPDNLEDKSDKTFTDDSEVEDIPHPQKRKANDHTGRSGTKKVKITAKNGRAQKTNGTEDDISKAASIPESTKASVNDGHFEDSEEDEDDEDYSAVINPQKRGLLERISVIRQRIGGLHHLPIDFRLDTRMQLEMFSEFIMAQDDESLWLVKVRDNVNWMLELASGRSGTQNWTMVKDFLDNLTAGITFGAVREKTNAAEKMIEEKKNREKQLKEAKLELGVMNKLHKANEKLERDKKETQKRLSDMVSKNKAMEKKVKDMQKEVGKLGSKIATAVGKAEKKHTTATEKLKKDHQKEIASCNAKITQNKQRTAALEKELYCGRCETTKHGKLISGRQRRNWMSRSWPRKRLPES